MASRHLCGPLLLLLAIGSCTVTTGTTGTCSPDSTVAGCVASSIGYSCTGSATPDESNASLNCSSGTPGNAGSTLYCCAPLPGPGTCAPDSTIANCPTSSTGYSCTGTDTPPESYPLVTCGTGIPGNAGATLYCCTSGGTDAGSPEAGATCMVDPTVSGCAAGSTGYSCVGGATPLQTNGALTCGSGTPGNAGSTLYCCTSGGATADAGDAAAETGPDAATDAAADGGVCAVSAATGSAACDQCLNAQCCSALVSCDTADSAGRNDAGATACEQLAQCLLDCLAGNPDAGVDGGTLSDCQTACNPSYSAGAQQSATALLQCQSMTCSTQCQ